MGSIRVLVRRGMYIIVVLRRSVRSGGVGGRRVSVRRSSSVHTTLRRGARVIGSRRDSMLAGMCRSLMLMRIDLVWISGRGGHHQLISGVGSWSVGLMGKGVGL